MVSSRTLVDRSCQRDTEYNGEEKDSIRNPAKPRCQMRIKVPQKRKQLIASACSHPNVTGVRIDFC